MDVIIETIKHKFIVVFIVLAGFVFLTCVNGIQAFTRLLLLNLCICHLVFTDQDRGQCPVIGL